MDYSLLIDGFKMARTTGAVQIENPMHRETATGLAPVLSRKPPKRLAGAAAGASRGD
jgi:hypothetical protein